jgi:hypothetical protein
MVAMLLLSILSDSYHINTYTFVKGMLNSTLYNEY